MNRSLPAQNTRRLTPAIALLNQVEPAGFRTTSQSRTFRAKDA